MGSRRCANATDSSWANNALWLKRSLSLRTMMTAYFSPAWMDGCSIGALGLRPNGVIDLIPLSPAKLAPFSCPAGKLAIRDPPQQFQGPPQPASGYRHR